MTPILLDDLPVWNRLIRFEDVHGQERYGEPIDEDLDVGIALHRGQDVYARILQTQSALDLTAVLSEEIVQVKKVLSPLRPEEAGTIRCIGLNYREHAAEMNLPLPKIPTLFLKPPSTINHPSSPVTTPHSPDLHDCHLDYEVELALVVGQTCKDVPEEDAMRYVLGYMTANDVTARTHQSEVSQWDRGKGFDGFAPIGPALVSARVVPDPSVLRLRTVLNGTVMQQGEASDMIFSVPEIVSFLSQGCTLQKGTIILTGTPCGIGVSRNPPVRLVEGDELFVTISHGLGTLTNSIASKETK
ncbi:Fumarylacetoacetate hydrolase domain-containing protein [Trichoderma ghanense]|uniref:Fumarylacetoacetate hydrolase domain-containing protein n=1 Tax=Trichoderma ghanense TaxID=65468 RepID=A0ABY2GYE8_9HYPO